MAEAAYAEVLETLGQVLNEETRKERRPCAPLYPTGLAPFRHALSELLSVPEIVKALHRGRSGWASTGKYSPYPTSSG
jgi:hypothetical protein